MVASCFSHGKPSSYVATSQKIQPPTGMDNALAICASYIPAGNNNIVNVIVHPYPCLLGLGCIY